MATPAVTPAAPAAAAPAPARAHQQSDHSDFLPEGKEYRLTGAMPTSVKEDAPAAASESDIAAASEAATTQQKPATSKTPQTSETRWQKLSRENREARDRETKLLERIARLEAPPAAAAATREPQQASQPAAAAADPNAVPRPKIDDVDPKTGKPKYADYAAFETAKDDWLVNEATRKTTEASQKTQRQQELANAERVLSQGLAKKFETSRGKYKDFDQVALNNGLIIPRGSAVDAFLLDADDPGEVLYYLGQHPEVLQGFYRDHDPQTGKFVNKISVPRQIRELTKIELEVTKKPASAAAAPAAKVISQAPAPPHQVPGKGTVPKETLAQAVTDGDSEAYIREANARELERRKTRK